MAFDLDPQYKQVPERIADFKAKHPEGSLRPLNPDRPYEIVEVVGQTFVVYVAAAFRHPEDPAPGVGTAWELVPGKTPYTKLSELQNAETSAWGRAIVAVLASESKAVASAEDVRNRQADHQAPQPGAWVGPAMTRLSALPDDVRERFIDKLERDAGVTLLSALPDTDAWEQWVERTLSKAEEAARAAAEGSSSPADDAGRPFEDTP